MTCAIFAKHYSSFAKISLISIHTHNSGQTFFHQTNLLADSANFSPANFLSFTVPQETYHIVRIIEEVHFDDLTKSVICWISKSSLIIICSIHKAFSPHIYIILITAVILLVGHSLKFCLPKNLNSWFCQCFPANF